MMQLVCNNNVLDLYENTNIQFKHTNPLFAFDKLECERTTQFKLPSTPTNDAVFGLSRLPAYAGTGMRRKFAAQLQAGTIVKDGYLYVSDYDGKDYTAILVTGDLVSLQAVKDAGNIGNYYAPNVTAQWGVITSPASTIFQTLRYANWRTYQQGLGYYNVDDARCRPCISLYILMVNVLQQYWGITIPNYPSEMQNLVYIPAEYKDANGDEISTQGTTISLQYNMPEWTGVQLIQHVCNALGYLPNYENNALTFVKQLSELSTPTDLTPRLLKRGQVTRTLAGFARNNYVEWKDADKYGGIAAARLNYAVDNDNIENTRVLATIPAQPTNRVTPLSYQSYSDVALCWDKYAKDDLTPEIKYPTGAEWFAFWNVYGGGDIYAKGLLTGWYVLPASPVVNPIMTAITSQATQIKVDARMNLLEYYKIKNTSTMLVDNSLYVWLERSWQKDTATFTLAKIA